MDFLLLMAPAFLGVIILILSVIYSRSWVGFFVHGILATILMMIGGGITLFFSGVVSATSGSQGGYRVLLTAAAFCAAALVIYIPVAILRLSDRKKEIDSKPPDSNLPTNDMPGGLESE